MFDALTNRLQEIFRGLGRHAKLRPEDVDRALRDIRLALLDADVHYQVVKPLIERVRARALTDEISRALNPSQQVIRVLREELVAALGVPGSLDLTGPSPRSILLVGLQGSGKTTTAAKLARLLRSRGERVWLVAADPYRPAAYQQLAILGGEVDALVFDPSGLEAVDAAARGVDAAARGGAGVVIIDSAGRSQMDETMMTELSAISARVRPVETLLVADAMTGQEALAIAKGFHDRLPLTGIILTKLDGDARGGAALSMHSITQVPIKFVGTGEGRDALEAFDPERLASRIIGMGDVLGLIERAEASLDRQQASEQAERLAQGDFSLQDLADQLTQVRRLGSIGEILDSLPRGLAPVGQVDASAAERRLTHMRAILGSMTRQERRRPEILNAGRKRRIAAGSGSSVQEVNQVLRQYQEMRKLFKQVGRRGMAGKLASLR